MGALYSYQILSHRFVPISMTLFIQFDSINPTNNANGMPSLRIAMPSNFDDDFVGMVYGFPIRRYRPLFHHSLQYKWWIHSVDYYAINAIWEHLLAVPKDLPESNQLDNMSQNHSQLRFIARDGLGEDTIYYVLLELLHQECRSLNPITFLIKYDSSCQ